MTPDTADERGATQGTVQGTAQGTAPGEPAGLRHIGILLFPDVEELDAVGPWEVLAWWVRHFPEDGYAVSCLSRDVGLVGCAKGAVAR